MVLKGMVSPKDTGAPFHEIQMARNFTVDIFSSKKSVPQHVSLLMALLTNLLLDPAISLYLALWQAISVNHPELP